MNLKSANSAINAACLTGVLIGVFTLIQTGFAILFSGGDWHGVVIAPFINIVSIFALSYGAWRKNKICAFLLVVYFVSLVMWKLMQSRGQALSWGIVIDFLVILLCLNGARGVFAFNKVKQNEIVSGQEYAGQ